MTNPTLISTPFAAAGGKNPIQESVPLEPNSPTWLTGFPTITSTPVSEGGLPPKRLDFNGVFNAITDNIVHQTKGLGYEFDATYATKIGGYPLHAELMLSNGDRVQSTVPNNIVDPNIDMTGWKLDDNTVESIAALSAIAAPKNGQRTYVKSYHLGVSKGGGEFVFDASRAAENDGITVFSGWVRQYSSLDVTMAGAKGDGVTDDTASVRNLVMFLYKKGGGVANFHESNLGYKLADTVYVVSNVIIDACGQKLIGSSTNPMFKTANVSGNAYQPVLVFAPYTVIRNAQLLNIRASNSVLVFDLISFTLSCSVKNIEFENCTQGFKLEQCFYSRWENLLATPSSGTISKPFYHLVSAANAMIFDRVTATVAWGWLIEGGNTALLFNACTYEGGQLGFKFKGDCLGLTFQSGYYEAITGTLFDFTEAGDCAVSFDGNYINGVDVVFDDGGVSRSKVLFGKWGESNTIVNIGADLGTGFTFRGLMRVSGSENYIDYELRRNIGADLTTPTNWITSKVTSLREKSRWNADAKADIRAVADVYSGIVPVKYSGDFGDPYPDSIPYCTKSTVPTGSNVSFTIDTQLSYQSVSLFAKVVLRFRRTVSGVYSDYYLYGDIYGANAEIKGGIDPKLVGSGAIAVALSNNSGKLRLTLSNVQNPNGDLTVTGTIRAVS